MIILTGWHGTQISGKDGRVGSHAKSKEKYIGLVGGAVREGGAAKTQRGEQTLEIHAKTAIQET